MSITFPVPEHYPLLECKAIVVDDDAVEKVTCIDLDCLVLLFALFSDYYVIGILIIDFVLLDFHGHRCVCVLYPQSWRRSDFFVGAVNLNLAFVPFVWMSLMHFMQV